MRYMDRVDEFKQLIKGKLKEERYIHSLNVADSAVHLAEKYGADTEKAYVAGLLHDVMKNENEANQLKILKDNGILLNQTELNNPKLWHAMSGAVYVKTVLGIDDEQIIGAIRYHTTGKCNMTLLEKVIYIADYISAERDYEDADVMRTLSEQSLEEAALYSLKFSLKSLSKNERVIHTDSVNFYNELIIEKLKLGNL